eukprot:EG_transcript_30195
MEYGIYQRLCERRLQEYHQERERWRQRNEALLESQQALKGEASFKRLAMGIGSSYLMGMTCAVPYYGAKAAFRSIRGARWRSAWAAAKVEGPRVGGLVATFNLVFTLAGWGVCYLRDSNPVETTTACASAFCAGAILSARRGPIPSMVSGAWVAFFVYLIHVASGRTKSHPGDPAATAPLGS